MPRINVMPKQLAELIAAGEVVERPASVIKELLENAIDAGATAITAEIKNGGITYMRVTDNGCGISREDIRNAFVSHATSKISSEADLESIMTLGFRGEALASVAAVAKVELLTRESGSKIGTRYVVEAGEEKLLDDAGCPKGTTVAVRDLFFSTPARMKFLKKDVSEANSVAGVVDRIALSHPEISFRFIRDGKQTLLTGGSGDCLCAAREIFGKEFAGELIPAEGAVDGVAVSGYVSKPSACRPNRNMQFFFINGRLVKTVTGSAAVSEAYKNSIMVGKFPGCILFIELAPESVDVNVHPAKTEVRFTDERRVFSAIYYACKGALANDTSVKQIKRQPKEDYYAKPLPAPEQIRITENKAPERVSADFWQHIPAAPAEAPAARPAQKPAAAFRSPAPSLSAGDDEIPDLAVKSAPIAAKPPEAPPAENLPAGQSAAETQEELRLIGEAFNTYIICEIGKKIVFIDKHAAHERIIYERLKRDSGAANSQVLMMPVTVTLTKEEYSAALENLDLFSKGGFACEDFGQGTLVVRECPMELSPADIADAVCEIAGRFAEKKQELMYEKLDWVYHSVACRSAIKAGDFTSRLEMERFAKELLSMPEIRCCPHGRPVMIEMTQRELERNFGRV